MTEIYIATEDALSELLLEKVILEVRRDLNIAVRLGRKGNGYLKKNLPEFVKTSENIPFILLTDLDNVGCAPALINAWKDKIVLPDSMIFRVAVREVEAWLLADRVGFSSFCGAPKNKIPQNVETLADPKQLLINLVGQYGGRDIKADILPKEGSLSKVGLGYNQVLRHFVSETWVLGRANRNSDSLMRMCESIRNL